MPACFQQMACPDGVVSVALLDCVTAGPSWQTTLEPLPCPVILSMALASMQHPCHANKYRPNHYAPRYHGNKSKAVLL